MKYSNEALKIIPAEDHDMKDTWIRNITEFETTQTPDYLQDFQQIPLFRYFRNPANRNNPITPATIQQEEISYFDFDKLEVAAAIEARKTHGYMYLMTNSRLTTLRISKSNLKKGKH